MSDETTLLPCPFCGGEAHMSASSDGYGVQCWNRRCIDMQMEEIPTEAEAIAAWNARVERTCECVAEYAKSPFDGKTVVLHRCSSCHELMRPHMRYCPNCGAKVVDA